MLKIKQHLNNYTNKYLKNKDWEVFENKHYIFNFFKNSVAEKEIKHISKIQERAYGKIIKFLELKDSNKKIQYYIYPSEKDKKRLMGDDGFGQAIWHDYSIHIIYTAKIKPIGEHEDTHLLILVWGSAIGFFAEGLAEYLSGCRWGKDKKPSEEFVKKGLQKNKNFSIQKMFSHRSWMDTSDAEADFYYSAACTFTKFLIGKHEMKKFKKFYKKLNRQNTKQKNIQIFEKIYELKIEDAEKQWKDFIGYNLII